MPALTSTRLNGAAASQRVGDCWLVGDWQRGEFSQASASIPSPNAECSFASLGEVIEFAERSQQVPELLFLAQSMPGEFQQAQIDQLQQQLPLTRIVVVAGTWCEGELRTGTPLSGVIRLYWYELASWWKAALRRVEAGLCPLWSLPLATPRSGRWSQAGDLLPAGKLQGRVFIDTEDFTAYETLQASLAAYEIETAWARTSDSSDGHAKSCAGIWDGGQLGESELQQLKRFCNRVPGPVVALLDFPRTEHFEQAQQAGAKAVLAKPYVVEELVAALID